MTTLELAKQELQNYTEKLGITVNVSFIVDPTRFDTERFPRFDAALDDAFAIDVKGGEGTICATNSRAVLLGVYHFLKVQGCRFFRPGPDGEYIPQITKAVDCCETFYAHNRHRGVADGGCNGGAEGMVELIRWLPKVMMNTFFIEMTDPYWAMVFAYRAGTNPYKTTKEITREDFNQKMAVITEELRVRGILRHGAGHGWTITVMEGVGELKNKLQLIALDEHPVCTNPEVLPMINGKRTIWDNTPLNTHLCLSNVAVRKTFVENVCKYAEEHPEIDYLHIWLGDAFANFCECEGCAAMTPTDWYVLLLNELDAELTRRGSKQKLVFLAYFELLYPPQVQRFNNQERFTMLFCPYGRDFTVPYRDVKPAEYTPALNNTFTWTDMRCDYYLQQLKGWQEVFGGDSVTFDYTTYDPASFLDMTGLNTAPLMADDAVFIKELGLGGRIECGNTRAQMPTPYTYLALAHGLFYGEPLDEKALFEDLFGKGEPISAFLYSIKDVIPMAMIRKQRASLTADEAAAMKAAAKGIETFLETLASYVPQTSFQKGQCDFAAKQLSLVKSVFLLIADNAKEIPQDLRLEAFRMEQEYPLAVPAGGFLRHVGDFLEAQATAE